MITIGSTFAGYRIEAVAGRGGMGVVYRARQRRPDRLVALKVLAAELHRDPQFRERFERESSIAASIEHPYVIPVYEVDEADGLLFIAMRYVDSPDLRSLSKLGLPLDWTARIVDQVARALDAAHARGLVHRDVKPANVLVSVTESDPHSYLTDFGLSKQLGPSDGATRSGAFVGTIDYVAPEQVRGEMVDARADVYSLACLLYECLVGRVPYPRDSHMAKMWAHVNEEPPSSLAPGTPHGNVWKTVIERGMAKEPAERYPSAGDLGRAALAALEGKRPPPHRARLVARGAAAPAQIPGVTAAEASEAPTAGSGVTYRTPHAVSPAPEKRRPRVGRRRVMFAAALGLALVSAGAGFLAIEGDDRSVVERLVGDPIPVGTTPTALAVGEGAVWVANLNGESISRVDPRSRRVRGEPISVGREPYGVAVGEGSVWSANFRDDTVSRIDPRSGGVMNKPIRVGRRPADVAVGFGAVWTANYEGASVTRIDAARGKPVKTIRVGDGPTDVAIGEGAVWAVNVEGDSLSRINPTSNEVVGAPIPVGDSPESVAVGAGSVWVANIKADTVTRIDPASNQVLGPPIAVGERPDDLVATDDGVFVANLDADTLTRIDPRTGKASELRVGNGPAALALAGDTLWIANFEAGTVSSVVRRHEPAAETRMSRPRLAAGDKDSSAGAALRPPPVQPKQGT